MLMTEKKMVRVIVKLDNEEKTAIETLDFVAESLIEVLEENQAKEMSSLITGEVIERSDLLRLRGILHGLARNTEWVLE